MHNEKCTMHDEERIEAARAWLKMTHNVVGMSDNHYIVQMLVNYADKVAADAVRKREIEIADELEYVVRESFAGTEFYAYQDAEFVKYVAKQLREGTAKG